MKTTPPKGTNDYMPKETALREWAQNTILECYRAFGYERITTPILEDAVNLNKSDGGENLSLIFQVMKRGEKLTEALEQNLPLWDLGLRYDLTVPLVRFYSNNQSKLPSPFKVIQIDRSYRAERPQKGRMREFIQCDIDILGDPSLRAETELIAVTAESLLRLGFEGFTILVNDRQVLNRMISGFGFPEEDLASVCISLDKLGKIGVKGVASELLDKGLSPNCIQELRNFLLKDDFSLEAMRAVTNNMPELDALAAMVDDLTTVAGGKWKLELDPTLVRGQGYYTGTIFEITLDGYSGSVGGGGRYDNMVEKFTGKSVPGVGFSIGFERIMSILEEKEFTVPNTKPKLALLYDENTPYPELYTRIKALQKQYLVTAMPKQKSIEKQVKRLKREEFGTMEFFETKEQVAL